MVKSIIDEVGEMLFREQQLIKNQFNKDELVKVMFNNNMLILESERVTSAILISDETYKNHNFEYEIVFNDLLKKGLNQNIVIKTDLNQFNKIEILQMACIFKLQTKIKINNIVIKGLLHMEMIFNPIKNNRGFLYYDLGEGEIAISQKEMEQYLIVLKAFTIAKELEDK